MRANQEIRKGCVHLKLNGIIFVREFPFYFKSHFELHYDINADPSIFTSPCLFKNTKPTPPVFCCTCSRGILRSGKIILVHPNSGNQILFPAPIKLLKPTIPSLEAGVSKVQEMGNFR